MITKEKYVAMNLTVPKDLKEEFTRVAYIVWTNPTNLMRMLMKQVIRTKQVNLTFWDPFENVEIEPLDISDFSGNFKQKTEEYTQELRTLLANRK
jgi:antitoxin component of RelBE/YafQ-DinJ toxin-antitoxin module